MRLLLDKGANINAQGGIYFNALQAAAFNGQAKAAQLLLDKGADFNARGGHYGNALRAASENGHIQVVQLLLEAGAIDTSIDSDGHEIWVDTIRHTESN